MGFAIPLSGLIRVHAKVVGDSRQDWFTDFRDFKTLRRRSNGITLVNAQLTSQLEDADMAQVVSDFAKEETGF